MNFVDFRNLMESDNFGATAYWKIRFRKSTWVPEKSHSLRSCKIFDSGKFSPSWNIWIRKPTYNHQPPSQVSSLTWTGYPFYKKNDKFSVGGALFAGPPPPPPGGGQQKAPQAQKFIVFFVKRVACPSETAYLRWWLVVVGRLVQKKLWNFEFPLKIIAICIWKLRFPHKSYDFIASCRGVWCKDLRNFYFYIDLGVGKS